MEDILDAVGGMLVKEVSKDRARLTVVAICVEKGQWQLSVRNQYGVSTNWLEFFPSAQLAVEAGLKAIEEGVEEFMDTEGFEYLLDESV